MLGELARELRIREAANTPGTALPALELIDTLVERPLTPVQVYEALAIDARDAEEAPQEIRDQLVRRSILVEVIGGAGFDNVAIGVQTDAGWSGGAISTLGGPFRIRRVETGPSQDYEPVAIAVESEVQESV